MINKRMPTAIAASIIFVVLTSLFLTIGAKTQHFNVYFGIFFTEVVVLGVTIYLICKIKKYDIKETLSLNIPLRGTRWKAFFIAIFSYPIIVFFNGIYFSLISKLINLPTDNAVPMPTSALNLLLSLFMFALLPGIFEEIVFRGFLFRTLDRYKPVARILITATLFALFHYNVMNVIGPFLMGITFGYLRYCSNSVFPSMIAHATNNSIAMIIGYFAMKSQSTQINSSVNDEMVEIESMLQGSETIVILIIAIIILLLSYALYRLLKRYPNYSEKTTLIIKPGKNEKIATTLMVIFGITVFIGSIILFIRAS